MGNVLYTSIIARRREARPGTGQKPRKIRKNGDNPSCPEIQLPCALRQLYHANILVFSWPTVSSEFASEGKVPTLTERAAEAADPMEDIWDMVVPMMEDPKRVERELL